MLELSSRFSKQAKLSGAELPHGMRASLKIRMKVNDGSPSVESFSLKVEKSNDVIMDKNLSNLYLIN